MADPIKELGATIPRIRASKGSELELELRFDIDERRKARGRRKLSPLDTTRLAKNIINHYVKAGNKCEVEQTINFIKDDVYMKQLTFVDGVQQKDKQKHYHKDRIIDTIFISNPLSYKIALAFERSLEPFPVSQCTKVRIKLRFSITDDPWRYDITLVRALNAANPQYIKKDKNKMFFKLTPEEFVDKAPWDFVHHIDFEAEYLDHSRFQTKDFKTPVNTISDFMEGLNSVVSTIDKASSPYQQTIYKIAQLMKLRNAKAFRVRLGLKQLSNQVLDLNTNMFINDVLPRIDEFYITIKIDGKRAMILLDTEGMHVLTDTYKLIPGDFKSVYVYDTEEFKDSYYIFDVLIEQSNLITDKSFSQRMKYFEAATEHKAPIKEKKFVLLDKDKYKSQIKAMQSAKYPYPDDGLILTPAEGSYSDMTVYKYKPIEKQSADFLIKKYPEKLLGIKPYLKDPKKTLYILFCGVNRQVYIKLRLELIKNYADMFPGVNPRDLPQYFPFQYEPSDTKYAYLYYDSTPDLDGKVGEFVVKNPGKDQTEYEWHLERIRDDRKTEVDRGLYFGNNYKVIEYIWMNYQDPLVIEGPTEYKPYFMKSDSDIHKPSRNFNSYVKFRIFEQFKNIEHVLDLASGKGQDLFRYGKAGVNNLVCLEIDRSALSELITRKHDFSRNRSPGKMSVSVQQMDLTVDYKTNISKIEKSGIGIPTQGFEIIVCNIAFHYMLGTKKSIDNVAKFIANYLKPGGRFIFTAFDGNAIMELLEETSEYKSEIKDKFHIMSDYESKVLKPYGMRIKVLLPFSLDEYYTEYLVNISYLEDVFSKHNMILETDESFGEYLDSYSRVNKSGYSSLDDDDKKYTSLYHHYCFFKRK